MSHRHAHINPSLLPNPGAKESHWDIELHKALHAIVSDIRISFDEISDGIGTFLTDGDKGDITVTGTGATWTIDNGVVTYAKMQDVSATDRILGRDTAGAGDAEELTLSQVLDFVGSAAQGDILYRGAATWTRLGAGTSGHFLQTQGAGANPSWAAVSGTPAGVVSPYAGLTEPTGWLFCFGQAISRTTFADLFAVISTTYGVGDGSTTFNLPDLRGRVVAGQDDMGGTSANRLTGGGGVDGDTLGGTGGAETHTLTTGEMPAHSHSTPLSQANNSAGSEAAAGANATDTITGPAGGSAAHNNVQPTIILNYIIKT